MYVEVLYDDLTRQRMLVEDAHKLRKVGVLAIILSGEDKESPRVEIDGVGYRRVAQMTGKDFYYLLNYKDGGDSWYALDGRDRGEFQRFYKSSNPWSVIATRQEHPRYGCFVMVFEGVHVSNEKWAEAMEVFEKEVH